MLAPAPPASPAASMRSFLLGHELGDVMRLAESGHTLASIVAAAGFGPWFTVRGL